jgi:hypothetical protein
MNFQPIYHILILYFVISLFHTPFSSDSDLSKTITNSSSDTFKLSATIDGKVINLINNADGIKFGSNSLKNIKKLPDTSKVIFQSYVYKVSGGDVIFELNIGTLHYLGMKPPIPEFENYFKTGKLNFSFLAMDGVEIRYRDNQGVLWSTSNGNQPDSYFELTEITNTNETVNFKAHFSCKLYNSEHESKTLEKGEFIGSFQNY